MIIVDMLPPSVVELHAAANRVNRDNGHGFRLNRIGRLSSGVGLTLGKRQDYRPPRESHGHPRVQCTRCLHSCTSLIRRNHLRTRHPGSNNPSTCSDIQVLHNTKRCKLCGENASKAVVPCMSPTAGQCLATTRKNAEKLDYVLSLLGMTCIPPEMRRVDQGCGAAKDSSSAVLRLLERQLTTCGF